MADTLPLREDSSIWRACNKIRATIFRENFKMLDYFLPLDAQGNGLISESKFVSVLNGPWKQRIGLSEHEIAEITDYFRLPDGRIYYKQFCQVLQDSVPKFCCNPPLVTGLELEDPFHTNMLSSSEERLLHAILCKIATLVNARWRVIRPYFQDYELIAKNGGTVTIGHFARVINFLGINLSPEDFRLLVKKFLKDNYTVNYVAFVVAIDNITQHLHKNVMLDIGGDLLPQFPGRAACSEFPKLPRPEIGSIHVADIFGEENVFHSVLNRPAVAEDLERVMRRVQRHVLTNRIRTGDFFKDFDILNSGHVTLSQFRRGLDNMGISGIDRLHLSEPEIDLIARMYTDPNDEARVHWTRFEDDVEQVFTVRNLEKIPNHRVIAPPPEVTELPNKGAISWHAVPTHTRDLCESVINNIKNKVSARRILLQPCFRDYDRLNNGHVTQAQLRQCLSAYGLLPSSEELHALEQRYCSDMGFNYVWFLNEIKPAKMEPSLYDDFLKKKMELNSRDKQQKEEQTERDIVEILAKLKAQVVCRGIRIIEFMRDFDIHKQQSISRENFWRGLDNCGIQLTAAEMETIMDIFASPLRSGRVDYVRFCNSVEEAVSQCCLNRAPLIVPLQHVPCHDGDHNFLNYEQRHVASRALDKLAQAANRSGDINLLPIFQDFDRSNCGSVPRDCLSRALAVRGLSGIITDEDIQVLAKCFATERGMRHEFNYREFCRLLTNLALLSPPNHFKTEDTHCKLVN